MAKSDALMKGIRGSAPHRNKKGHFTSAASAVPRKSTASTGGNFIKGAIKHPGALHRELGVPVGQKIPAGKLATAASGSMGPKVQRQADLAKTLAKLGPKK